MPGQDQDSAGQIDSHRPGSTGGGVADFSEWSKKAFWNKLLGSRGEISIFTGALHSDDHGREMIGDWDLRAASELTTYFSLHQYRPKIESPIYQKECADLSTTNYISQVLGQLKLGDKNCLVIASPDVNPLTEIAPGEIHGVEYEKLFSETPLDFGKCRKAVVVTKDRGKDPESRKAAVHAHRAFYRETVRTDVHAHLVAARNTFQQSRVRRITATSSCSTA